MFPALLLLLATAAPPVSATLYVLDESDGPPGFDPMRNAVYLQGREEDRLSPSGASAAVRRLCLLRPRTEDQHEWVRAHRLRSVEWVRLEIEVTRRGLLVPTDEWRTTFARAIQFDFNTDNDLDLEVLRRQWVPLMREPWGWLRKHYTHSVYGEAWTLFEKVPGEKRFQVALDIRLSDAAEPAFPIYETRFWQYPRATNGLARDEKICSDALRDDF